MTSDRITRKELEADDIGLMIGFWHKDITLGGKQIRMVIVRRGKEHGNKGYLVVDSSQQHIIADVETLDSAVEHYNAYVLRSPMPDSVLIAR